MNRRCFVAMPFSDLYTGIWLHVIKPTVEAVGDNCLRADNIFTPGTIINDVFSEIKKSDYIIADLSGHNPNVYYELGYAHALDKIVILITNDRSSLPFDISHHRIISYDNSVLGAEKLKLNLSKFISNL